MSILKLGIAVKELLETNEFVTGRVGDRIFPLSAPEGAERPYIVYQHPDCSTSDTKDGRSGEFATIQIGIAANDYDEAVTIEEIIDTVLNRRINAYEIDSDTPDISSTTADTDGTTVYITTTYRYSSYY